MSLMLPQVIQNGFIAVLKPLISLFGRTKVNPNWFTTFGLIINLMGAVAFALGAKYGTREELGYIGWGGFLILMGGICDILDGKVARAAGLTTRFGALYDSVLDRYSEVIMFIGMGYYLIVLNYFYESVFCFIALGGSTMVSYIRARSESLNLDCKIGLMQRPERVVWLGLGSFFCGLSVFVIDPTYVLEWNGIHLFKPIYLFTAPIVIVAILSNYTCIQRMIYSHRLSQKLDEAAENPAPKQNISV